jgi:hypothetical protein
MLTAVFAEVPENAFDRCLELGAGASSTIGFVLAHAGRRPRHAELFAEVSAAPGTDAGLASGAWR